MGLGRPFDSGFCLDNPFIPPRRLSNGMPTGRRSPPRHALHFFTVSLAPLRYNGPFIPPAPVAMRLLIIDDDTELCELLSEYLQQEGFAVKACHDSLPGLEAAISGGHDFVVLDVMLPGMSGFELLRRLRLHSGIPVLMLTARGDEIDRIVGLEMGADDYLPKPFNPRELVARIRAIQRRGGTGLHLRRPGLKQLIVDDLVIDPGTRNVLRNNAAVTLTAVEFSLLQALLAHIGEVMHREVLAEQVLGRKLELFDRSIDVHISSLRRKLGNTIHGGERIKTVRSIGYMYCATDTNT